MAIYNNATTAITFKICSRCNKISTEPVLKKLQRRKISVLYTGGSDFKEDFKKIIPRMIRKKTPKYILMLQKKLPRRKISYFYTGESDSNEDFKERGFQIYINDQKEASKEENLRFLYWWE